MKRVLLFVTALLWLGIGPAIAGGPDIPKATGEPHPEGNLYMRINHMKLMSHDRDETVRDGDRSVEYSLKECVTCHAVNAADGQPVSYESDKHFCRVCHDYVAVKVDCFQCHNSKPEMKSQALIREDHADPNQIATYLKEAQE